MRWILALMFMLAVPACGGVAVCGPFDGACRAAAEFAQAEVGIEPASVREWECPPAPRRCFDFTFPDGAELGVIVLPDGHIGTVVTDEAGR